VKVILLGLLPGFLVKFNTVEGEIDFLVCEFAVLTHGVEANHKLGLYSLKWSIAKLLPFSLFRNKLFIVGDLFLSIFFLLFVPLLFILFLLLFSLVNFLVVCNGCVE